MIKENRYRIRRVSLKVVRENWGFPFISGFIVLLFSAAIVLAAGSESIADIIATTAYFMLFTGVILQFNVAKRAVLTISRFLLKIVSRSS